MGNDFLNKYEQKSDFQPPKKKPKKKEAPKYTELIIGISSGIAALIVLIVVMVLLFSSKVTIPNVIGWKADDISLWAKENNVLVRYSEVYSDEVTSGLVIDQLPLEGGNVEKGEFLEVSISLGPDPSVLVKVPDFMTMSQKEIEAWEAQNYMTKVRITTQNSETVELGTVIEFTVNDDSVIGEEVRRDSPIYITISKGTALTGNVTLPDFMIMTVAEAQKFAEDNGIILELEEVFDDMIPKEQIISQDIDAEQVVKVGDTVILKVSKGAEILMPNFASYDVDMAGNIASQNGIMVMIKEKYSSTSAGRLISQSASAGSLYDGEEIVTLTYSLGNTVLIPSFVGQGIDALSNWVEEYNAQGTSIKISKTYTTSQDMPGTIITQDKADTNSGISTTINVIISEGDIVYVPDLVANKGVGYDQAITREKAMQMCNEVGLVAVFVAENASDRLEGEVWSQSISAGKEVQQGTTITLKYKPVTSTVKVPKFVGMTKAEIEAAGYDKSFNISYEGDGTADAIVESQSVTAGTTVAPGTEIILINYMESFE